MTQEIHTPQPPIDDDEISLIDIIRFLHRNGRFISLLTLGFVAIALPFALLKPNAYERQLTLSVGSKPIALSANQQIGLDAARANTLATEKLKSQEWQEISAQPTYDATKQEIALTLRSPNPEALKQLTPDAIATQLQTDLQDELLDTIKPNLEAIALQIQRSRQVLKSVETDIAKTSTSNTPRLEALEVQRASNLSYIAALEVDRDYLQQAQSKIAEISKIVLPINIKTASDVTQKARSPLQIAILSLIAGFMLATLAAIIREQIPRLKAELSREEGK